MPAAKAGTHLKNGQKTASILKFLSRIENNQNSTVVVDNRLNITVTTIFDHEYD